MDLSKDIINDVSHLRKNFEENNVPVNKLVVFGSYARGTQHRHSDIDVAVISSAFSGIRFYDIEKVIPLMDDVNPYIEVHPYSTKDLESGEEWFLEEILKTGIEI